MKRTLLLGASAVSLALVIDQAQAATPLPVTNLTFTQFNNGNFATQNPQKGLFSFVDPTDWSGGTNLISIDAPGTATLFNESNGNSYGVYAPFADPPVPGNFVQADANPTFETAFTQVIHGLTPGQEYSLTFLQAAGQQQGFTGDTTEEWKVFLAAAGGSFSVNCGAGLLCAPSPRQALSRRMTRP